MLMENIFEGLKPERLWYYFGEICRIPRPSRKEEQIAAWVMQKGREFGLEVLQDPTGNVLIRKQATRGMENRPGIILQSHLDMVCEKNSGTVHNFETDPILPRIEGEWVKATGTTLGADDGIGVAVMLAIMEPGNLVHGPLEFLFTIDEETGLSGSAGLKPGFLKGRILLNLDSEDDGELFIGCAGGKDTSIVLPYSKEAFPEGFASFRIDVSGLKGGHSGDDINKGLGNAIKILNRLLWEAASRFGLRLCFFEGGNLRNAIAREAFAMVAIPESIVETFEQYVIAFGSRVMLELKTTEPDLKVASIHAETAAFCLTVLSQERLLNSLYACPHGVMAMSADIPGFVETSTNLASVKTKEDHMLIGTSQRSSVQSSKDDIANMVASVFRLAEGTVTHGEGYPGWTPNPDSPILQLTRNTYTALFDLEPKVLVIHAGLECGLIGKIFPGMDMISYGPTIKGVHSPDERILIPTVSKFWDLTVELLKNIPAE
jgi:dipeptidase D